jgi:hypothetical protein
MDHKTDYLPKRDSELAAWSNNFTEQVELHATEMEIPPDEVATLRTANDNFQTLHLQADSPQKNSIIVAEKEAAKKVLMETIRGLVGFRLKNPVITDVQRIAMGLHVRDTTPTRIPVPSTRPEVSLAVADIREIVVNFHDMGSSSKARPYGVVGAVLAYSMLDAQPTSIDQLTRTTLATKTPHILEFTEEDRGKTVYIAACWQNERGEKGHFSEIANAIIP